MAPGSDNKASTDALLERARNLNSRAQAERDLGNTVRAVELYTELEDLQRRAGNPQGVAHAVRHQADIHRENALTELARALYEEALDIYRDESGTSPPDLANALRGLALSYSLARQPDQARPLWEEAREIYESAGFKAGADECNMWLKASGP
ncbi:MAG: tetratricopeptide repeat protein [Xanthomonadales bacterium]|nr:tetratricopeptide repeat protein [Xanthomonadales bacterium]NIX14285.1 tetratricopeptide repeat protein [Xanthomonadales bacterium]